MIVIIDNYDSFVHNLARYCREAGYETSVYRHDEISVEKVHALCPVGIILSPGPKGPKEAGICCPLIAASSDIPMLGVCLGHQCMADVYDGKTVRAQEPMHGRSSLIMHNGTALFEGIKSPMSVARYHSLIADVPADSDLCITARSGLGEIMAIQHRDLPHFGVQFHPESILTPDGRLLLGNFLRFAAKYKEGV